MAAGGLFGCKFLVLPAGKALAQSRQHPSHISAQQGRRIEPEAGKHPALNQAARLGWNFLVFVLAKFRPSHPLLSCHPDQVFADSIAAVGGFFLVQIVCPRTPNNFDCQFRRAFEVVILRNPCLPSPP